MEIDIKLDDEFEVKHYLPYIQFTFARLRPDIASVKVTMRSYQDSLDKIVHDCNFVIETRRGYQVAITDTQNIFDLAFKRALQRCARTLQRHLSTPHKLVS